MPLNTLTTEVGLKVGPVLLETLVKHYVDRLKKHASRGSTQLKRDELLYDEAFNIVKAFMKAACFHSVEELQEFSNTRTPSPPWTRVVRTTIPLASCDTAATYLIQALGGEEHARNVVGGVKWWQVRGLEGIEAQWITAKKDWREAKKRYKAQREAEANGIEVPNHHSGESPEELKYEEAMDDMRCVLYCHGGGYFFGSVDQERYSIERIARKINGRVLAINYRLAPQYPFPCALQDALAAYLYLTEPPPGSDHRPVHPSQIVVAGDSAGGGLALALLQVLRDVGLPMPAGGILISPWSDMTHSFPSIHTNTETDIMPDWGLSLMKPSILWPPPTDEQTRRTHHSLRSRIRHAISPKMPTPRASVSTIRSTQSRPLPDHPLPIDIGSTTSVPSLHNETIRLVTEGGEVLTIDRQVQLYAPNSLLAHPLVSPALSYLGGLPPLLVVASDGEVLRDEIIYTAHKAANPTQYTVHPSARDLYPPLRDIEEKHPPTKVHLQIYDDAAHVLPVLFAFTTPAKYCFRAMATFCKHVTMSGTACDPTSPPATSKSMPNMPSTPLNSDYEAALSGAELRAVQSAPPPGLEKSRSIKRTISVRMRRVVHAMQSPNLESHKKRQQVLSPLAPVPEGQVSEQKPALQSHSPSDVGGPRFEAQSSAVHHNPERYAGEPTVYRTQGDEYLWAGPMLRERVSTRGILRPLESESDLVACNMPPDVVGFLSERAIRRYLDNTAIFDKKFARHVKLIESRRRRNLKRAERQTTKNLDAYKDFTARRRNTVPGPLEPTSLNKGWAWALDVHEKPPPSSIVARRDTKEASQLAKSADRSIFEGEPALSGNNFWSILVNFFTATPERFPAGKGNSP